MRSWARFVEGVRSFVLTVFWQETAVQHKAMMSVEMKPVPNDLIDALLADYKKPEQLIGQNGLRQQTVSYVNTDMRYWSVFGALQSS